MQMTDLSPRSGQKITRSFTVLNERGLHTRPSTELVKLASKFKSSITLHCGEESANAKSLLGVLMLAAAYGTKIELAAEGEDAEQAVSSLLKLAANKFSTDY